MSERESWDTDEDWEKALELEAERDTLKEALLTIAERMGQLLGGLIRKNRAVEAEKKLRDMEHDLENLERSAVVSIVGSVPKKAK